MELFAFGFRGSPVVPHPNDIFLRYPRETDAAPVAGDIRALVGVYPAILPDIVVMALKNEVLDHERFDDGGSVFDFDLLLNVAVVADRKGFELPIPYRDVISLREPGGGVGVLANRETLKFLKVAAFHGLYHGLHSLCRLGKACIR